ncbi:MAG: copper-translocating P-type ATPase [Fibrobacterota bacterium]
MGHSGHQQKPSQNNNHTTAHEKQSGTQQHHQHHIALFRRRFWVSLVITIPILLLSPLIQSVLGIREALSFPGDILTLWGLSSFVYFYGGWPFLKGLVSELRSHQPGMMTLIGLAISVAYLYSSAVVFGVEGEVFFWELATLIDVMLLGHWIEMRTVAGASQAVETLVKLLPSEAHRVIDGQTEDVSLQDIKSNDMVLVKPGEKVPVDGSITDGESSVNESMVTGESLPVHKKKGQKIIGGSVNGEGSLTVEVEKTGEDTFLSQVVNLVRESQMARSRTQNLADRAAVWLTGVALGSGLITILVWYVLLDTPFEFALERTVTVMVIACPHALGLAIPLVVAMSTALSASNGLLIRQRSAFEKARNIQAILFDKTGTLTLGKFGVSDVVSLSEDMDKETVLTYAASVEAHSEHPIARGIVESAEKKLEVENFKSITGKGARGVVEGREVKVVSPGFLRENNIKADMENVEPLRASGKTVVFVIVDGKVKGAVALSDIIRPESKEAIRKIREMGIRPMMITGDNRKVADWVSKEIGIEEYFAEVLPQEKVDKVKEVQKRGLVTAMTGDGINDAPALAQADVGMAIGAGTDVAAETADIILVRSNPGDVVAVIGLARATYRKMVQNLWYATGYNAVAIPLAAGVLYRYGIILSPALGAALMSLSTVVVAINARLLKFGGG